MFEPIFIVVVLSNSLDQLNSPSMFDTSSNLGCHNVPLNLDIFEVHNLELP